MCHGSLACVMVVLHVSWLSCMCHGCLVCVMCTCVSLCILVGFGLCIYTFVCHDLYLLTCLLGVCHDV